jgi:hypothetical protein
LASKEKKAVDGRDKPGHDDSLVTSPVAAPRRRWYQRRPWPINPKNRKN